MNKKLLGVSILLLFGLVLSAGCIQSQAPADTVPVNTVTAPTAESVVGDLTSGTGTNASDVTSEDLDALQSDLDELDVSVDELSDSDI